MTTAVILTKNEEDNISRCLRSLAGFDEIVVIDDFSTDFTIRKIGKTKKNIRIYKRHLSNDFAGQRNFALREAQGKNSWVLFIDADEVISNELKKEIKRSIRLASLAQDDKVGFYLKRKDIFLGKELLHGEAGNIKLLRLGKKSAGKWKRKVHEYWDIKGKTNELRNPILHYHTKSLSDFITKINKYSRVHAFELKEEGRKASAIKIIIWPVGKFFVNYFLKLGFLDGVPGLIMAVMMSFHSFLAWSNLWIS